MKRKLINFRKVNFEDPISFSPTEQGHNKTSDNFKGVECKDA